MKVGNRCHKQASCRVVISTAFGDDQELRDGVREVVSLASDNPRKGHATFLMHQVCAEADVDGIVLILMPKPFGEGMTEEQLVKFYEKFGFTTIQPEPKLMARQPRMVRAPRLIHSRALQS